MATRILGIDLGTYSVKVIVVVPGFRQAAVTEVIERKLPPSGDAHLEVAARVVGEIVREHKLQEDTAITAMSGSEVFMHVLDLPLRNAKRQELERAVGSELEGVLPIDLEDMAFAFDQLPKETSVGEDLGAPLGDSDPTFVGGVQVQRGLVAEPAVGIRVLACATTRDRVRARLKALESAGAEPRSVLAAPAAYRRLAERVWEPTSAKGPGPISAIIDIGHERTDVCVVQGHRAVFARSISRGGAALTSAIARTWGLSHERAEEAKHQDGFVASAAEPPQSEAWARIHSVLVKELDPLARDLRRTLATCRAKTGCSVSRAVIVGGGSRLRGLASFLSEQLQVPVSTLSAAQDEQIVGAAVGRGAHADIAALAASVAFEGATGRAAFDLRQGDLAYKADLSFLRGKASYLAVAALAIVGFATLNGWMGLEKLRKAEKTLSERIALESAAAFGEQLDAEAVLAKVGPIDGSGGLTPIPSSTAYDVMLAFNEAIPAREEITIDVEELEIKPGKITVKATSFQTGETSALDGINKLKAALRESKCFSDFKDPKSQPGKDDSREFTLTIPTECNQD